MPRGGQLCSLTGRSPSRCPLGLDWDLWVSDPKVTDTLTRINPKLIESVGHHLHSCVVDSMKEGSAMEKSLQLVLVKEPETRPYVPWRPTVEREPELNPFGNVVD